MKYTILLFIVFVFLSCNTLQSGYYNTNQQKTFPSVQSYIDTTAKETGLDASRIIVLKDAEFKSIATDIVRDGLSTYYGIAYKSEIISANELNIKSCQGQIIQLYRAIPDKGQFLKSEISSFEYLRNLHFNPVKKTMVILYSYKLGGLTKAKILPVIDGLKDDPDFEYYVISLDNPDIVK
ncbi:hypothetical protein HYN59_04970 [Flavobacterium album]|uniref:Uncharacterized protein n=1 Tax=Flavobacterium album TaxID=2175091 RepID=A0A2S1QVT6_9FLAO|nr:hypothetical protein [Flavobacterium album]AWH84508.1 hypothetical protein HYN59_04970 [Flavobacterium album]